MALDWNVVNETLKRDYAAAIEAQRNQPGLLERFYGREEADLMMAEYEARLLAEHDAAWLAVLA